MWFCDLRKNDNVVNASYKCASCNCILFKFVLNVASRVSGKLYIDSRLYEIKVKECTVKCDDGVD